MNYFAFSSCILRDFVLIWKCDATEYSSKLMRMAFTYGKNAFSVFHSYESKELRRGNRSNAFFARSFGFALFLINLI